jgi:hypothetical protein
LHKTAKAAVFSKPWDFGFKKNQPAAPSLSLRPLQRQGGDFDLLSTPSITSVEKFSPHRYPDYKGHDDLETFLQTNQLISSSQTCHNTYAHMNSTQRAHILIPADLLREIDALVGPRGRSAFLLETAREELRRRKLLHFLEGDQPAWQVKDHPEDSVAWVRKLRSEGEGRVAAASSGSRPRSKQKRNKQI